MDILPIISILASLLLLLFVLIYSYYLNKKVQGFSQEESKIYEKSDQVMEQALQKAQRVLKDAIEKAKKMLSQTDYFQREIERESRGAFLQTSRRYIELFDDDLKNLASTYKDLFMKLEEHAVEQINQAVEDQNLSSKLYLQKRIDEEYERARKEIDDFKQAQLEKAAASVENLINKAAKEVLQRSLSREDQNELIIKALEKAKAEGIFE